MQLRHLIHDGINRSRRVPERTISPREAFYARAISAWDVTLHLRSAIQVAAVPCLAATTTSWGALAACSVTLVNGLTCRSVVRYVRIRMR
jgi:hypothetical protein